MAVSSVAPPMRKPSRVDAFARHAAPGVEPLGQELLNTTLISLVHFGVVGEEHSRWSH